MRERAVRNWYLDPVAGERSRLGLLAGLCGQWPGFEIYRGSRSLAWTFGVTFSVPKNRMLEELRVFLKVENGRWLCDLAHCTDGHPSLHSSSGLW